MSQLKIYIENLIAKKQFYSEKTLKNFKIQILDEIRKIFESRKKNYLQLSQRYSISINEHEQIADLVSNRLLNFFEISSERAFSEAIFNIQKNIEKSNPKGFFSIYALSILKRKKINTDKVVGFSRLNKKGNVVKINLVSYLYLLIDKLLIDWFRSYSQLIASSKGIDLARVSPQPCWLGAHVDEVCNRWRDKIVSMSGFTSGFPKLQTALDEKPPLFHPNCRHTLIPLTHTEQSFALNNKIMVYSELTKRMK